jgi:hypothetical protein
LKGEAHNPKNIDVKVKHYNLNDNFLPREFYENLKKEDHSQLTLKLLGLKSANGKKFDSFFTQLLNIVGNSSTSTKAKINAITLIRDMIEISREKKFDIIEDIVNLGIVKVLCNGIKTYSN